MAVNPFAPITPKAYTKLQESCNSYDELCRIMASHWHELDTRHWGGVLWCALTFVEDVCATCPAYADKSWDSLRRAMDAFAESYRLLVPDMDEFGTTLYEAMAIALEV